ncbi:MAG: hypothetical protein ABFD10_20400 [Prolixibacteraceae bacterium]|jgi:hypothetical protein
MRKNRFINILLVVFILVNGVYLICRNRKEHDRSDSGILGKIQDRYVWLENWKDSTLISDLAKNRPVLILRLPRVPCQQCKFAELENLNSFFRNDTTRQVCALLTTQTPRDLMSLKLSFNYNFLKAGSYSENILDMPQEGFKRPYYFVLMPDMQAKMIFFPDPDKAQETNRYFEEVENKYFDERKIK